MAGGFLTPLVSTAVHRSWGPGNDLGLKTEGDKLSDRVFIILATIMPADVCEINNHPSVVREIIEHILKARYQQKLKSGDGRHQYNENKLAPQSD